MADTTSIASRMEKLAQLKRMKSGLSEASAAPQAPEAAEPAIAIPAPTVEQPAAETTESAPVQAAEPSFEDTFNSNDEPTIELPSDAPDLGSLVADEPEAPADFDFGGGASDELGETDFSADASVDTGEIPADLQEPEDDLDTAATSEHSDSDADASQTAMTAADLGIDDEAMDALDDLVALAGVGELAEDTAATPDFTMAEIDPELLDREFADEADDSSAAPMSSTEDSGRVAVTFDESRTTLLNHVSRQMNCSVEDVVVTALDWYLDALFGEDEEAKAG